MQFTFAHNNFNVLDLDRSLAFYREALGLTEAQGQGLLHALGRETLAVTTCGREHALGCIKWHEEGPHAPFGYMNLMFN